MAEQKLNTTTSLTNANATLTDADIKKVVKRAELKFGKQKQVDFSIPPAFQKYIGSTLFIAVQGVSVNIPVDGNKYPIPEVLATHGQEYLNQLKV